MRPTLVLNKPAHSTCIHACRSNLIGQGPSEPMNLTPTYKFAHYNYSHIGSTQATHCRCPYTHFKTPHTFFVNCAHLRCRQRTLSPSPPNTSDIPLHLDVLAGFTQPCSGLLQCMDDTAILFMCDKHAMFTTCPCTRPGYARFTVKMLVSSTVIHG